MYEFCFLTNSKTHGVACCLVSHLELFFLLFLLCLDAITTVVHQSLWIYFFDICSYFFFFSPRLLKVLASFSCIRLCCCYTPFFLFFLKVLNHCFRLIASWCCTGCIVVSSSSLLRHRFSIFLRCPLALRYITSSAVRCCAINSAWGLQTCFNRGRHQIFIFFPHVSRMGWSHEEVSGWFYWFVCYIPTSLIGGITCRECPKINGLFVWRQVVGEKMLGKWFFWLLKKRTRKPIGRMCHKLNSLTLKK